MSEKKYKVIALSVGGLGNKIFHDGDQVSENNFLPGRADELVELGFLAPIGETASTLVHPNPNENKGKDHTEKVNTNPEPCKKVRTIDEVSVKELIEDLNKRGEIFKVDSTKQELYDLWIKE